MKRVKKSAKKVSTRKKAPDRKSRVEKTRNLNSLTESEYFSKLRSALRSAFRFWKPAMKALEDVSRPSQDATNKRLKKQYRCSNCKRWYARSNVEVHHVVECGSLKGYDDVVPFIQRLCCEDPAGYKILCKPCHKEEHKK